MTAKTSPSEKVFVEMPTNKNGETVAVIQQKIEEWKETYPAVDVEQEVRLAWQWCMDNPQRRKTKNGVFRFLNNWLARAQNRGGRFAAGGYMTPAANRQFKATQAQPISPYGRKMVPEWYLQLPEWAEFVYKGHSYRKVDDATYQTTEEPFRRTLALNLFGCG